MEIDRNTDSEKKRKKDSVREGFKVKLFQDIHGYEACNMLIGARKKPIRADV